MTIPGYAAEASLYKTARFYRAYGGAASGYAAGSIVPSQVCGDDCFAVCGVVAGGATAGCITALIAALAAPPPIDVVLAGVAFGICEALGVGVAAIGCALNCPSCPSGGPPPPPMCCPVGRRCGCGGSCVPLAGGGYRCIGGLCLVPRQECP